MWRSKLTKLQIVNESRVFFRDFAGLVFSVTRTNHGPEHPIDPNLPSNLPSNRSASTLKIGQPIPKIPCCRLATDLLHGVWSVTFGRLVARWTRVTNDRPGPVSEWRQENQL